MQARRRRDEHRGGNVPTGGPTGSEGRRSLLRRPFVVAAVCGFCLFCYAAIVWLALLVCESLGFFVWRELSFLAKGWFVFSTIVIVGSLGLVAILAMVDADTKD